MLDPAARLREAVIGGNLAITKRLLARFPDLWLNTDSAHEGWCNLHYASFYGHYLICFHLVSLMHRLNKHTGQFCDLDLVTFENYTVLHMPLRHRHSQTLHFLLQEFSGQKWLDFKGGPYLRTPVHECCVYRFADGLKLLLEFGADWSLTDANGDTCLHLCFAYGDLDSTEALLKYVMADALAKRSNADAENHKNIGSSADISPQKPLGTHVKSAVNTNSESDREFLNAVIQKLENTPNAKGQLPVAYAASFDMENAYFLHKRKWVDRVLEEELLLKSAQWDASLSMYEYSEKRAPFLSPGVSLANYGNIALILRTSLDSDLLDNISPGGDPYLSASTSRASPSRAGISGANLAANSGASSVVTTAVNDHDSVHTVSAAKGRKHLRLLPNGDSEYVPPDAARPQRQHAKLFAFNFRGLPLMTRSSTASLQLPISPLQVEFNSTQTRKLSLTLQARLPQKGDDVDRVSSQVLEHPRKSSSAATPTSGSFVHLLIFSPLLAMRRKSVSADDAAIDPPKKDRTAISKYPSSSMLRKKPSSDSLKRNFSTPAKLGTVFRAAESPTTALRQSRRPSMAESPTNTTPGKLPLVSSSDAGGPLEPQAEVAEKKFVYAIQKPLPLLKERPNLRIKTPHEIEKGAEEDNSQNIRSISFVRVREE